MINFKKELSKQFPCCLIYVPTYLFDPSCIKCCNLIGYSQVPKLLTKTLYLLRKPCPNLPEAKVKVKCLQKALALNS